MPTTCGRWRVPVEPRDLHLQSAETTCLGCDDFVELFHQAVQFIDAFGLFAFLGDKTDNGSMTEKHRTHDTLTKKERASRSTTPWSNQKQHVSGAAGVLFRGVQCHDTETDNRPTSRAQQHMHTHDAAALPLCGGRLKK